MRRGLSLLLAAVWALVSVSVAGSTATSIPAPWIVFISCTVADGDGLGGTFLILNDPLPSAERNPFPGAVPRQVVIGEPVVAGLPWILDTLNHQRLTLFYELEAKRIPPGGPGASGELLQSAKVANCDCAVLRHRVTGQRVHLLQLEKVYGRNPRALTFPSTPATGRWLGLPRHLDLPFAEEREPSQPIRHEPGTGPLLGMEPQAWLNSPYYELADGRLVYWETINQRLVVRQRAP